MPQVIPRPESGDYSPFHADYVAAVPEGNVLDRLMEQAHATQALLRGITGKQALHRYAEGKWSVKEVLGHLIDAERVFAYRALCFARADNTELPGFDQDAYVAAAGFDRRSLSDLLDEYAAVRAATMRLYESFGEEELARGGIANGQRVTVGALAWIIAGHERNHQRALREKYLG